MKFAPFAVLSLVCATVLAISPTASAGLIVHYRFEERDSTTVTTVADSSGNGFHGGFFDNNSGNDANKAVSGATPAGLAGAWRFDGLGMGAADIVEFNVSVLPVAAQTALAGANARTFAAWINPETLGDRRIVGYGATPGGQFFGLTLESDAMGAHVKLRRGDGFEVHRPTQATNPIDVNRVEYLHVVAVVPTGAVNAKDVLVYLDGVLATHGGGGGMITDIALSTTFAADSYVGVGRRGNNSATPGGGQDGFLGQIADFQFYDMALSQANVQYLYMNPGAAIPEASAVILALLAITGGAMRRWR